VKADTDVNNYLGDVKIDRIDSPHTKTRIESKPVELLVSEPLREDGLAWEILRSNPAPAFFLHAGELPMEEESAKQLRADLTDIFERYPKCIYAERIKENLPTAVIKGIITQLTVLVIARFLL